MFTIYNSDSPCSRRKFLTVGGLALGGLSLSSLFQAKALAGEDSSKLDTGKSVIFLFQQGGPSQFETFDPKPDAVEDVRTVTGVTKTALPGVIFGDTLEKLAKVADKFTTVRSFFTGNAGHNIRPIVGPESLDANLGSLYTRVVGPIHPTKHVPRNAVLLPQSLRSDVAEGQGRGDLSATGALGSSLAPFIPGNSGKGQNSLRLSLPADRFEDRKALLSKMDDIRRDADSQFDEFDQVQKQAMEVLLRGSVANALDLSKEDPKTLKLYDTSHHAATDGWSKVNRGKRGYYSGHAKTLGKALLLARRLCEAGCGFVTIHTGYEGVWDMHADGNNLNMKDGMTAVGRSFDHAVAAFMEDVAARVLTDKIMLIATGEMGRTPKLNKGGGRDHWAKLAPLFLFGGGTPEGKVVGRSTRDGGSPDGDGFGTPNLISTIIHTMLDVGQLRLKPALSAISKLAEPKPIA